MTFHRMEMPWGRRVRTPGATPIGLRRQPRVRLLRPWITLLVLALVAVAPGRAAAQAPSDPTDPAPAAAPDIAPRATPDAPAAKPPAAPAVKPAARAHADPPKPPSDLGDLDGWLRTMRAMHLTSLPDESRLFYRRGRIAARGGDPQEAIRLVRGAVELDPSFMAPHLTLASWFLTRDPSQSLLSYAAAVGLVRRNFLFQIELVANAAVFILQGLFLGFLATGLILVLVHQGELRHIWEERLRRVVSPTSARLWGWALLVLPFTVGLGLALPALAFLGLLWPVLAKRERVVVVALTLALVAAPFSGLLIGRLAIPLRDDRGPLLGIAGLPEESWSAPRQAAIERLAREHAEDPYVLFGLGWFSCKGGDLAKAEEAYRGALARWPADPRVLNNLGNVRAARGDFGEAMDLYREAVSADPQDAAAYFNESQILTRQFDYHAASDAAARASALDFDLVKGQQARGTEDGVVPLADRWLSPKTLWQRVLAQDDAGAVVPVLPFAWRERIETSGAPFAAVALALGIAGPLLGWRLHRSMPLRACRNCGRVICRCCARRRREQALCEACAGQESRAESPEFVKVLLGRERGRVERRRRLARTALATLVPGYGLLAFQAVASVVFILTAMATLVAPWLGARAPFAYQPGPGPTDNHAFILGTIMALILLDLASLLGYVTRTARASAQAATTRAPVRSRPTPARPPTARAA